MPRNPLDWTTQRLNVTMERSQVRIMEEIRVEQVQHVTEQYQEGSERLERLYEQMELAKRFTSPTDLTFNF